MMAGTAYEHKVLDAIGVSRKDRQIRKFTLRLRVNLDGETRMKISEVKTWLGEKEDSFSVSKSYWEQCQVEMYAAKKECQIVAYRVSSGNALVYIGPASAGDQRIVLTKAAELGLGYGIYTPPAETPEEPDEPAGDDIEALRAELEASKAEAQALRNSLASMTAERDTALQQAQESEEKAEAATERAEHAEAKIKAAQAALEG